MPIGEPAQFPSFPRLLRPVGKSAEQGSLADSQLGVSIANRDASSPGPSLRPATIASMSPPHAPPTDHEPGQLLKELEQRQDDVLAQLDDLDAKLREVLEGLGASADDPVDPEMV